MSILYRYLTEMVNDTYTGNELTKKIENSAKLLLLNNRLIVGHTAYRLTEVEFYFNDGAGHADPYAHSAQYPNRVKQKQSVVGAWYFHRFAGMATYTHTRRGLDLTFGNGDRGVYGGILIRAIQHIASGAVTSGPSRVVGAIIQAMDNPLAIQDAAERLTAGYAFDRHSLLRLEAYETPLDMPVYKSPRFGLGNKHPYYRDLEYRFFTSLA